MRKILFFLLLILYSLNAVSTSINGTFTTMANTTIYAFIDDDYITDAQKLVAQSEVDASGKFALEITTKNVQKICVKTIDYIFYLYCFEGNNYNVKLSLPNANFKKDNKQLLKVKIIEEPQPQINLQINAADSVIDKFVTSHYKQFVHPRSLKLAVDSLKKKYPAAICNTPYVVQYFMYAIASLDEASAMRETYFYKHYTNNEIASQNSPAFYNYFNQHYASYFESIITKPCFGNAATLINEQHNCEAILQKMRVCDTILKNDSLRELLFVKGLYKLYYKREYKKESIEMMLNYMTFKSEFESVKKVAKNLVKKITKLNIGTKAPNFNLLSSANDSIKLESLKGKLVYICFTNYSNLTWLTHLSILERLQLLYDKKILIVTITLAKDMPQLKALQNDKKLSGLILNGYDNLALNDNYLIDELPKYYLIDADGDILKNNNCSPVDGIEEIIKAELKK